MWMAGGCFSQAFRAVQSASLSCALRQTVRQQCGRRNYIHITTASTSPPLETSSYRSKSASSLNQNASNFKLVKQGILSCFTSLKSEPGNIVFARTLTSSSKCLASAKSEDSSKSKGELVYRGNLMGLIRGVKIFSLSTSLIGLCLQPYLFLNNEGLPTALKVAMGGIVNFFVFINPFIIHYIAKKYVTDIHWNKETGVFTAAKLSFFVRRQEIEFTADDVTVPDIPGMFTVLEVKGIPLFVVPQDYLSQEAYIHLMGYDKPLDWELPKRDQEEQKRAQN